MKAKPTKKPGEVTLELNRRDEPLMDAATRTAVKSPFTLKRILVPIDADAIVVGTHGRTGLKHVFLGSVAERVVRHTQCPVLVVRESRSEPTRRLEPTLH